ncbi:hypothetical protein QBC43DRAFT_307575 [Cladorrhinum sp. PSN259]|nr:hypothetical protein QBC43DRAFT_307575 [Cladorrhinum sp. PSN259]
MSHPNSHLSTHPSDSGAPPAKLTLSVAETWHSALIIKLWLLYAPRTSMLPWTPESESLNFECRLIQVVCQSPMLQACCSLRCRAHHPGDIKMTIRVGHDRQPRCLATVLDLPDKCSCAFAVLCKAEMWYRRDGSKCAWAAAAVSLTPCCNASTWALWISHLASSQLLLLSYYLSTIVIAEDRTTLDTFPFRRGPWRGCGGLVVC